MTNRAMIRISAGVPVLLGVLSLVTASDSTPPGLSFDERVAAQLAIERVYYAHRTETTRSLDAVATPEVLAGKVQNYLTKSLALERYWKRRVTAKMLEREVGRMVRQSKMPDRLLVNYFGSDRRIHAGTRLVAERLHRDLTLGVVDPLEPDERRIVIQRTPRSPKANVELRAGRVEPIRDELRAFTIEVRPFHAESGEEWGTVRYVVRKRPLDEWLETFAASHAGEGAPSVATDDLVNTMNRLTAATTGDPTGCSTGV